MTNHDERRGGWAHEGWRRVSAVSRPGRLLIALWTAVGLGLGGWHALTRPPALTAPSIQAGELSVLDERPRARILTLWLRWEAPRGSIGWVALEPGRPWPGAGESYWRRRIRPGVNQLVWDDFSGFPSHRPVTMRVRAGEGRVALAPAETSTGYSFAHLRSLSGLLVSVVLGAIIAGRLAWRSARRPGLPTPRGWHLALLGIAVLALVLRLYTLTTQSFWFDEVLTAIGAQSFAWVLYSPKVFGHPPLQYLVTWLLGGPHASEGWMRAPFVAAGVVSVIAVGLLGRRLLGGATGLVAAILLAISPFHVELSQLARPYAFLVLGTSLSWFLLFAALERGRALEWAGFSVAAALSCYTHYLAGIVVLAQALAAVTWIARHRGATLGRTGVSFAAIALLLAPWAATLTQVFRGQVGGGHLSATMLRDFIAGALVAELLGSGAAAGVTAVLLCLGMWCARHRPEIAVAVVTLLALPLLVLWVSNPPQALAGRYFAFVLPMLVLTVAHGLVSTARALGHGLTAALGAHRGHARRAATAGAALLLILTSNLPARAGLDEYYRWRRGGDWHTVAALLDRLVAPGDEVVATLGAVYPLRYYWRDEVREVDGPELWARYTSVAATRPLWIVTLEGWDWAPDLHRWLDTHAIQVGEVSPSWSLPRVYVHRAGGMAASSPLVPESLRMAGLSPR